MINYKRTQWYGVTYLWRLRGSLLPHCLPAMILAGLIAGLSSSSLLEDSTGLSTDDLFAEPYSMQLFGVVFGYLAVARLNVSYNRYWEGITHVKAMHSKFSDACSQVIIFDRIDDPSEDVSNEAFCRHMVRLFVQLSAMAILMLHLDDDDVDKLWERIEDGIPVHMANDKAVKRAAAQNARISGNRSRMRRGPLHEDWLHRMLSRADHILRRGEHRKVARQRSHRLRRLAGLPGCDIRSQSGRVMGPAGRLASPQAAGATPVASSSGSSASPVDEAVYPASGSTPGHASSHPRSQTARRPSFTAPNHSDPQAQTRKAALMRSRSSLDVWAESVPPMEYAARELELEKLFTYREVAYLRGAPCPVLATAHRISRAVSTRGRVRGWKVSVPPCPPACLARPHASLGSVAPELHPYALPDPSAARCTRKAPTFGALPTPFAEYPGPFASPPWKAPAPIVSRIYQELSNGMLAYNNATKMKEVPVPFAYVQVRLRRRATSTESAWLERTRSLYTRVSPSPLSSLCSSTLCCSTFSTSCHPLLSRVSPRTSSCRCSQHHS